MTKINILEKGKTGEYAAYIPQDELPDIRAGKTAVIGIDGNDGKPVGGGDPS